MGVFGNLGFLQEGNRKATKGMYGRGLTLFDPLLGGQKGVKSSFTPYEGRRGP